MRNYHPLRLQRLATRECIPLQGDKGMDYQVVRNLPSVHEINMTSLSVENKSYCCFLPELFLPK